MTDRPARHQRPHLDHVGDLDQLRLLRESGFTWLLDVLSDGSVYRAGGRLHIGRAARAAGMSWATFNRRLERARAICGGDANG